MEKKERKKERKKEIIQKITNEASKQLERVEIKIDRPSEKEKDNKREKMSSWHERSKALFKERERKRERETRKAFLCGLTF